jgi:hypothetical protein
LGQLVADEENGQALGHQSGQGREQRLALLRRQHRRRLVQDQDAGAAARRPEDLRPLALAQRQRADGACGSTANPKRLATASSLARAAPRRLKGCQQRSA